MIRRDQILLYTCAACLAEGAAKPQNPLPDTDRLQTVAVYRPAQEFPEPHPPTDEAGVQFEGPPIVSSAISGSAGFLEDDSAWYMMNMMRPSSGWSYNVPQRFYDSDWS